MLPTAGPHANLRAPVSGEGPFFSSPFNHNSPHLKMTEKRKWRTLMVEVAPEAGEEAAAALARMTGAGVLVEDGEERCRISAYIEEDGRKTETLGQIRGWARTTGASVAIGEVVVEEDWLSEWKKGFTPLRAGKRLIVSPSWEDVHPGTDEVVVTIDPGTAFGTGHHESTAMALELIEELYDDSRHPARVLDIGCGTGILAIACARLGAGSVLALDCDPEAVRMTEENARINGVAGTIQASATPVDAAGSGFELICANIIHNTLVEMAPAIAQACATGGHLVLAGILGGWQEENIRRIYRKAGFSTVDTRHRNEWAALLMRREER